MLLQPGHDPFRRRFGCFPSQLFADDPSGSFAAGHRKITSITWLLAEVEVKTKLV